MHTRDQARQIFSASLAVLAAISFTQGAAAQDKSDDRKVDGALLPNYTRELKANSFQSRKYSKGFKVKGWQFTDDIYMGSVKVAGEYGPGMVVDKGGYVWGFNHERIEFQLRF